MATTTLAVVHGEKTKPSSFLHSIFMSTVNAASNTLCQVASSTTSSKGDKWKASDHFRYMLMLSIWLTLWVLRVMIEHFPCSFVPSPPAILDGFVWWMSLPSSWSSSMVLHQGLGSGFEGPPTRAVGRALSHVRSNSQSVILVYGAFVRRENFSRWFTLLLFGLALFFFFFFSWGKRILLHKS